jgi:rare lipoprotein A
LRTSTEIAKCSGLGERPWFRRRSSSDRSAPGASSSGTTARCSARVLRQAATVALAAGILLLAVGCHHQTRQAYQPAPPTVGSSRSEKHHEIAKAPPHEPLPRANDEALGRPILVETGMASWYGPSFQHHAAADGSKYNQNGMTAAHKTLPMGTVVRVTNLANGEQVMVRITDRGPFSHGRILDLSEGAAKKIDLYRMGVAKVKVEAFAHSSADPAGRWCVQTGAFKSQGDALDLKNALIKRYEGAKVIEFAGPTGYWVRIDPLKHDKTTAEAILDWIGAPDPQAKPYLVRLD